MREDNKILLKVNELLSVSDDFDKFLMKLKSYLLKLLEGDEDYKHVIAISVGGRDDDFFELVDIGNPRLTGKNLEKYIKKRINKIELEKGD